MAHFYLSPEGDDKNSGTEDSPWQSLHRVADALKLQTNEDVIVHLAPGIHRLNETLILGPEHGGGRAHKVTFRGSDQGAAISSGYALGNWTLVEEELPDLSAELQGKVWSTTLPQGTKVSCLYGPHGSIPRAKGDAIQPQPTRFETGQEVPATYGPNGQISPAKRYDGGAHPEWIHQGFAFPEGAIQPAEDLHEAEFLIIPKMQWTMNVLPLKAVDFEKCFVELAKPCTYPIGIPHCAPSGSIWLENSLSVMKPGTWVYHAGSGRLFYCPEGDEPEADLEAASLSEFIRLEGVYDLVGEKRPIQNVHIENLTLTHSNRFAFHGLTGKGIQHDWEMHDAPSSMVRMRHATGCSVSGCTFEHGGSGGVRLDLACRDNRVESNTFRHLGACGVLLSGYGPGRHYLNRNNHVTDNHIHHVGEQYWHSPAIFIWQSGDNHIARNHIHDTPYTGIVCSGRILYDREGVEECSGAIFWDDVEEQCGKDYVYNIWWYSGITDWWKREPLLHSRENLIEYNHIHDVMQTMGDGDGIYVSGAGGGNVVRFNVVGPCPSPTMSEGIRCDDDQHHTIIHGNLIYALGGRATGITLKGINRVTNNILALPTTCPLRGHLSLETGPLNGSIIKNNIFLTSATDQQDVSERRIHGTGRKARLADTDSDNNIYYCMADPDHSRERLDKIQSMGTDVNSRVVDPGFVDPLGGDFNLKPESPAREMGFRPLPLDKMFVGRRSCS